MTTPLKTTVLIVGGGPVGLTLAMDLALRGVNVTVAEIRAFGEVPSVKCNHISSRSMEIFRRLGVASKLRDAGLPADHPNDASFRTTVTGTELGRIPIPCRRDRYTSKNGPDTWWPTPEPPHRINQLYIEPILGLHAATLDGLTVLNRTEILSWEHQPENGAESVHAVALNLETNEQFTIEADYLVGCDGGRSPVRKAMGAEFVGDAVVQRVQSTHIRAPKLLELTQAENSWAIVALNPRRSGTLYAIDGREQFIVHNYLKPHEEDFEAIDRDWAIRTILGVDEAFEYEVVAKEDWIGRRLVADKLRNGRVFICGDAAHIWVPYGGYGMNAGLADAANLAWLLAAAVNGWGGDNILDAYEAERLPITQQTSHYAMSYAEKMIKNRGVVPENIEADGVEADDVRRTYGQKMVDLNVQQYCCAGLNFGYYYDQSGLIVYDGEPQPDYSMGSFTPSTVPGCRTPHVWLADGSSLYDALGSDYALIRTDPSVDVSALLAAAAKRDVPLTVVDVAASVAGDVYTHCLTLSRPDQHVAWRGDGVPNDALALVDKIRGAKSSGG